MTHEAKKRGVSSRIAPLLATAAAALLVPGGSGARAQALSPAGQPYRIDGTLPLGGGWQAGYRAFRETDTERDESGSELAVTGALGGWQLALKRTARRDHRRPGGGQVRQEEVSLAPRGPLRLGPLRDATVRLSYATGAGPGGARGRRLGLTCGGALGPHRLGFEWGQAQGGAQPDTRTWSLRLDTDARRALRVGAHWKATHVRGAAAPLSEQACHLALRLAPGRELSAGLSRNSGSGPCETTRTETLAFTAALGRGSALAADHRRSRQEGAGGASIHATSLCFSGSSGGPSTWELRLGQEKTRSAQGRATVQSVGLSYAYRASEATQVQLAAQWTGRAGCQGAAGRSEVQVSVDAKLRL